jgi:hypothetical protein
MPNKQFALEKGGPKRLEVSWHGIWKDIQVKYDGQLLGRIDGQAELKKGREFQLPDGTPVNVKLNTGFMNQGLMLSHNGQPLPGTGGDPETMVKTAGALIYVIAAFNLAIGVATFLFNIDMLKSQFGAGPIIMAVVFAPLGFFTMKRSRAALIIAMLLFGADSIASLVMVASSGHYNFGFLVMRFFFLVAMFRGVKAIGELKAAPAQTQLA